MKSKKICIMTINGDNFGNRLQNYALQEILKKCGLDVYTLINACSKYDEKIKLNKVFIFFYCNIYLKTKKISSLKRSKFFKKFDKENIKFSKFYVNNNKKTWNNQLINSYDYFICGSDQIWNSSFLSNGAAHFLYFVPKKKKLTYAPSFGTSEIQPVRKEEYKKYLEDFQDISIREDKGKEIIKELTGYDKTKVLVDPTMLLTNEEWDIVSKKPAQIDNIKGKKYILNCFLGSLSDSREKEISRVAKENNCCIINLLDKNDPYYVCGPSEFLYLEKHAFLICTDSFHSSVFAILYDRPFVVFDREEQGMNDMGSRLDTLINRFRLENRRYNGKNITQENLNHDYTEAYKILAEERKKSDAFLRKALDIKDGE